jgi:hypothetical protein
VNKARNEMHEWQRLSERRVRRYGVCVCVCVCVYVSE